MAVTERAEPISPPLSEAFQRAVWLYDEWSYAMPELQVGFDGKSYSMTEICGLVDNLGDELPTQVVDRLLYYMQAPHADLKASLSQERSYSVAARCLRELI